MDLETARLKAGLAVADIKKMYKDFTGDPTPYEDIGVYGDDGDYPGHEIIRYDGNLISLIENCTIEGIKDKNGLYLIDHLHNIMSKYFDEWERENHFCLNVYGVDNEEEA